MRPVWMAAVMGIALVALSPTSAHAWLKGKAAPAGGTVYKQANSSSAVVGTVPGGRALALSDRPTNGFYRVNAGGGIAGWISENDVEIAGVTPSASSSGQGSGGGHTLGGKTTYIGPLLGLGFYEGGSRLNFGVTGGLKLSPQWGLGLYLTYASKSESSAAANISATAKLIIIAPEANYFFNELPGFHVGGKLGLAMTSIDYSGTTTTSTNNSSSSSGLVFGAAAAYDMQVSSDWSVGGEANFLIYSESGSSSTTTTGSTTTTSSSTTAIHLLLSAKYWF